MFVTINYRNSYIVALPDHLWLPFIDKPQSYVVVFAMIYSEVYKYLIPKCEHRISIHEIVTSDEYL